MNSGRANKTASFRERRIRIQTRCKICAESIRPEARVCNACKSYQNNILRWLILISSITGFASLLAALSFFAFNQFNQYRNEQIISGKIIPLAFQYPTLFGGPGFIAVSNQSGHDLYIRSVDVFMPRGEANYTIPVNQIIGKQSSNRYHDHVTIDTSDTSGPFAPLGPGLWLRNKTGFVHENVYAESLRWQVPNRCVTFMLTLADDPDVTRMNRFYQQNFGDRLMTLENVEAYIVIFSPIKKKIEYVKIDRAILIFQALNASASQERCQLANWDQLG
jgi:hypothetical protein